MYCNGVIGEGNIVWLWGTHKGEVGFDGIEDGNLRIFGTIAESLWVNEISVEFMIFGRFGYSVLLDGMS